jgi:hypothetical protein
LRQGRRMVSSTLELMVYLYPAPGWWSKAAG